MSWRDALEVFDIATRALGALAIVVVFLISRTVVTRQAFATWLKEFKENLDERYQQIDGRLNRGDTAFEVMRTEDKHRPTREDIDGMRRDLNSVTGTLRELVADRGAMKDRLSHIEDEVSMLVRLQMGNGA